MTARIVTAEELIDYLSDIINEYGNIPVITGHQNVGVFESVGQPSVLTVNPTREVSGFQAYEYATPESARRTKAAFIY